MTPEHDAVLRRTVHLAAALYPNASKDEVARHAVQMFKFALAEAERKKADRIANAAWMVERQRLTDALMVRGVGDLDPHTCNRVTAGGQVVSTLEDEVDRTRELAEEAAPRIMRGRPA